jgi:carboxyl-terminal processing protease
VAGVLHGYPAHHAGILVGDRLVAVNGAPYHPIRSFAGQAGRRLTLTVERRPGETVELRVIPELIDGRNMFENAMRASIQVIEQDGHRLGYLRAWSYAGRRYQDIVTGALINGALKDTDAFILDIRGGWGGADPAYLNFFSNRTTAATAVMRDGTSTTFASSWSKPVVLLADDGSRSGKELLAHGFRALDKGPVIGERTAGAVLSGQINALTDGSVLYLAIADVRVDGQRLEGVGVAPDIEVPFDIPYAAGADPQLTRAIAEAINLLGSE